MRGRILSLCVFVVMHTPVKVFSTICNFTRIGNSFSRGCVLKTYSIALNTVVYCIHLLKTGRALVQYLV